MYASIKQPLETIVIERSGPVAFVTLDRPATRNAMNQKMVYELLDFFNKIRDDRSVRGVILRGANEIFCSGADIKEMADPEYQRPEAQAEYARSLDELLTAVQFAPQVTVVVVEGAAMGGGFGLVCVSDVAIATRDAVFSLPEVRLGIAPSVISPFVLQRIGLAQTRRLALTGRRLNGFGAQEIGLVHEVALDDALDAHLEQIIDEVMQASPEALAETKALLFQVAGMTVAESHDLRVDTLSRLRSTSGAEGMAAFKEKRKPSWVPDESPIVRD